MNAIVLIVVALAVVGAGLIVAGVVLLVGIGWGLVTAGALLLSACAVLRGGLRA